MFSLIRHSHYRILALLLAFVCVLAPVRVAYAHGVEVLKSDPQEGAILAQPPAQVRVWFSEEARSGDSTLQVLDSQGARVDAGNGGVDLDDPDHASLIVDLPSLPDGFYVVKWHVSLTDGDVADGQFQFTIGQVSSTVSSNSPKVEAISQEVSAQSSYPPPDASATRLSAYPAPQAAIASEPASSSATGASRWLVPVVTGAVILLLVVVGLGFFYLRRLKQPGS